MSDPNKTTLIKARLSYPALFTAKAIEEGKKAKFSANFILDKDENADQIKNIEKLIQRVKLDFFKKEVKLKNKCLREGDEDAYEDKAGYGEDKMVLIASSVQRPVTVDRRRNPVAEADGVLYAGCYVNALVRLFAYDHPTGGKGVSAELLAVQFVENGESFGASSVDVEKEFDDLGDEGGSKSKSSKKKTESDDLDDY